MRHLLIKLNLSILLILLFCSGSNDSVAYAAMPTAFKPGHTSLSLENEYFWSNKNYNQNGTAESLTSENSYKILMSSLVANYNIDSEWALSGGLNFASAKSRNITSERSNSRLTSAYAKAQYLLAWSQFRIIPEIKTNLAFQNIDPAGDYVLTDEGVNTYAVGTWGIMRILKTRIYAFLGYEYRDSGRSSLMPWNIGLSYRTTRWTWAGEVNGYQSVTDDDYVSNRSVRTTVTNSVDGGSLKFYAVNPSLTQAMVRGDYQLNREFSIYGGGTYTLAGQSTAAGQSVLVGFTYTIDTGSESDSFGPKGRQYKRNTVHEDFVPAVEQDYDESLFEPESEVVAPDAVESPNDNEPESRAPKKSARPAAKRSKTGRD